MSAFCFENSKKKMKSLGTGIIHDGGHVQCIAGSRMVDGRDAQFAIYYFV